MDHSHSHSGSHSGFDSHARSSVADLPITGQATPTFRGRDLSAGCAAVVAIVVGAIVLVALVLLVLGVVGGVVPFAPTDALSAAGVFGRGANAEMLRSVDAVTTALKANLLGFVGATIVLVIIALAIAHIVGDQRAQEKTAKLVQGVFMLVAATGFVA